MLRSSVIIWTLLILGNTIMVLSGFMVGARRQDSYQDEFEQNSCLHLEDMKTSVISCDIFDQNNIKLHTVVWDSGDQHHYCASPEVSSALCRTTDGEAVCYDRLYNKKNDASTLQWRLVQCYRAPQIKAESGS